VKKIKDALRRNLDNITVASIFTETGEFEAAEKVHKIAVEEKCIAPNP